MQKDYCQNPITCIWECSKYLKSIVDDSLIGCNAIINAVDSVS